MNKKQLRILLAPLDWGLGHVTRCLPIIQHILSLGHQVIFAGNADQQLYVKNTYPEIEFLLLEGYNVQYAKTKIGFLPKIIGQIPRLKKCIKKEQLWLQSNIKKYKIDGVISDNRYGLYSDLVPCIFMTHQLQIRSGFDQFFDSILLKLHYRFIEKFSSCWVVDTEEGEGLSGSLAHPKQLPKIGTTYIGLLSQCAGKATKEAHQDFLVLILLSGAEPQRTMLSDILWKKALRSDQHILFVAGTDYAATPDHIPDHISFHKRLAPAELLLAINSASIVICRSGYSSLMDLVALNKKAILIPTPGQTEQEYLAKRMHKQKVFISTNQQKFDIHTSLLNASLFPFAQDAFKDSFEQYKPVVQNWLKTIATAKTA